MRRRIAVALFLLLAAVPAFAQDAVRLRSGRVLSGEIAVDPKDADGFSVTCWNTGAALRILWSQVPPEERDRLLRREPEPVPGEAIIHGVLVLTSARDVLGVVVKEDAAILHVKTARAAAPTPVPKSAILRKIAVRVPESDVFTTEEMLQRRAPDEGDARSLIAVGRFAARLKLFDRAREFYEKALAADPARKDEIVALIQANARLIVDA